METDFLSQYKKDNFNIWRDVYSINFIKEGSDVEHNLRDLLNEVMLRIIQNLSVIYNSLIEFDYFFYDFKSNNKYYKERNSVLKLKQNLEVNKLLTKQKLKNKLPLTLEFFYNYIDFIDFRGYFKNLETSFLLDPIYFEKDTEVIEISEFLDLKSFSSIFNKELPVLIFSPDEFHKEDISGDLGYGIFLNEKLIFDSEMVFYKKHFYFLEYVNLCLKWGGFPNLEFIDPSLIPDHLKRYIKYINERLIRII